MLNNFIYYFYKTRKKRGHNIELTIIICLIVITIAFVAFLIEAIKTFAQIRRSSEAVEILSLHANNRINSIGTAIETTKVISSGGSLGWFKMITDIVGLFAAKKASEKHSKNCDESEESAED